MSRERWPIAQVCWLVVRDRHRHAAEVREKRIAAGWICTPIGRSQGCLFCERAGERVQIAMERFHPDDAVPC
jgi:hypothetical protein